MNVEEDSVHALKKIRFIPLTPSCNKYIARDSSRTDASLINLASFKKTTPHVPQPSKGVLEIIGESIAEQAKASHLGWRAAAAKSRCVQLRWGRIGNTIHLYLPFFA